MAVPSLKSPVKRVAVIGAGPIGIMATKHLLDRNLDVTVFEQWGRIGGQWAYGSPHSGIYRDLYTVLPTSIMTVCGVDFPESNKSFVAHTEVLRYLEKLAECSGVTPRVRLNCPVTNVQPIQEDGRDVWLLEAGNGDEGFYVKEVFDAVVVCNGRQSLPYIPPDLGAQAANFHGSVSHSFAYNRPDTYRDRKVILLGAQNSGRDIAVQLTKSAKTVYLSYRQNDKNTDLSHFEEHKNLVRKPAIVEVLRDSVRLENGEILHVDDIIWCTGYRLNFPFLHTDCQMSVSRKDVTPKLYRGIVPPSHPSLVMLGLVKHCLGFRTFDMQGQFAASYLSGNAKLSQAEEVDVNNDDSVPADMWLYLSILSDEARVPNVEIGVRKVYEYVMTRRNQDFSTLRQSKIECKGDHFTIDGTPVFDTPAA